MLSRSVSGFIVHLFRCLRVIKDIICKIFLVIICKIPALNSNLFFQEFYITQIVKRKRRFMKINPINYNLQTSYRLAFKGSNNWAPPPEFNTFIKNSKARLELTDSCIRTYIASPDNLFEDKVIPHIQKETGISKENTIYLDISYSGNLSDTLLNNLDKIHSKKEDNLIVVLKGFEKVFGQTGCPLSGHGYDQSLNLCDNTLKETGRTFTSKGYVYAKSFEELLKGKKLFLITHISDSSGKYIYDNALATAKDSQFKDDWVEIK